jgi:hypothetical protein
VVTTLRKISAAVTDKGQIKAVYGKKGMICVEVNHCIFRNTLNILLSFLFFILKKIKEKVKGQVLWSKEILDFFSHFRASVPDGPTPQPFLFFIP